MTTERWMALLFAAGSLCFLIGPFPGFIRFGRCRDGRPAQASAA